MVGVSGFGFSALLGSSGLLPSRPPLGAQAATGPRTRRKVQGLRLLGVVVRLGFRG